MSTPASIGELQETFLAALQPPLENDVRIRAAWLAGSLGRGDADRYSDIDLHMLLDPAQVEFFRAEAEAWLGRIRPLVLYRLLFDGMMINALTADGLRIDIWLHDDAAKALDPAKTLLLYHVPGAIDYDNEPVASPSANHTLADQIREFWRCIALTPSVIGRDELLVSMMGLGIEVHILTDILINGYQAPRDAGVKKLNAFLPGETRAMLESALRTVEMTAASMVAAHLNLAAILQEHGPIIAQKHGFAYPVELENAVLAHVADELGRIGISTHIG